jgi:hypothetical protein
VADDAAFSVNYGKAGASVRGRDAIVIFLLAVLVCGQLWFSWHAVTHLSSQHTAILEEIQVQTYLLSRPDSERPALAMPKALLERMLRHPYSPTLDKEGR